MSTPLEPVYNKPAFVNQGPFDYVLRDQSLVSTLLYLILFIIILVFCVKFGYRIATGVLNKLLGGFGATGGGEIEIKDGGDCGCTGGGEDSDSDIGGGDDSDDSDYEGGTMTVKIPFRGKTGKESPKKFIRFDNRRISTLKSGDTVIMKACMPGLTGEGKDREKEFTIAKILRYENIMTAIEKHKSDLGHPEKTSADSIFDKEFKEFYGDMKPGSKYAYIELK
jgi:hypothetical protein